MPFIGITQNIETNCDKPYIEVTGTAEMEIVPDMIYLNIDLKEYFDGKTKITISQLEDSLKTQLKSAGIEMSKLSVSDASINFISVKWTKKDALSSKSYVLLLSSATEVKKTVDALGIKNINVSLEKVSHTKLPEYKKQVKIEAMKATKEKAEYLLESIGEEIGKPLIIKEENQYVSAGYVSQRASNRSYSSYDKFESEELNFKTIMLKYSIYAKFEIK